MPDAHHKVIVEEGKVKEVVGGKVVEEKDLGHVLAGLKATIASSRTGEEAKRHAEERIQELERLAHPSDNVDKNDEHYRRVIGGLRAALHRDSTSNEKKKEIRAKLKEMGVGESADTA